MNFCRQNWPVHSSSDFLSYSAEIHMDKVSHPKFSANICDYVQSLTYRHELHSGAIRWLYFPIKYQAKMDYLGKVLYLISSTTSDEDKKFMTFTTGLSQRFFKKLLFPKSVWPLFVYKTIEFQLDSRLSLQENLCWQ